jgi:hypothetical protein
VIYAAFPNEMAVFLHDGEWYGEGTGQFADMLRNDGNALEIVWKMCDGQSPLGRSAQERIRSLLSPVRLRRITLAKLLGLKY